MNWSVGDLAGDVPKRDVDGREAIDQGAAAPEYMEFLLQIERELAGLRCIAADALRSKDGIDGGLHRGNGRKAERLAPADDTGVGCDRDDQRIGRLPAFSSTPRARARRSTRRKGNSQRDGFYSGNLHGDLTGLMTGGPAPV
jgi:hypothetical protein